MPSSFVSKAEQLRYLRAHPSSQHGTNKHFENLHVRIVDNTGIVNGIVVATGTKSRKTIFTDVFALRNGRWQAVNAQESPFTQRAGNRQSPFADGGGLVRIHYQSELLAEASVRLARSTEKLKGTASTE